MKAYDVKRFDAYVRNPMDPRSDIYHSSHQFNSDEEVEQFKKDNPRHTLVPKEDPIEKELEDVDDRIRNTEKTSNKRSPN